MNNDKYFKAVAVVAIMVIIFLAGRDAIRLSSPPIAAVGISMVFAGLAVLAWPSKYISIAFGGLFVLLLVSANWMPDWPTYSGTFTDKVEAGQYHYQVKPYWLNGRLEYVVAVQPDREITNELLHEYSMLTELGFQPYGWSYRGNGPGVVYRLPEEFRIEHNYPDRFKTVENVVRTLEWLQSGEEPMGSYTWGHPEEISSLGLDTFVE